MLRVLALFALAASASAQQFTRVTSGVPSSASDTEQVDFADVDLDGDWDAAFGNGGDTGNQQSVLWINSGGLQGGSIGAFTNETAARFPAILAGTRDLEFADYDADGDPDVALANHSQIVNQPSRFWVNRGGAQGATIGTYVDETAGRWVGLGAPGSSIPPSQLIGGGFLEFPQEIDFADVDSDGDLDFVQSTVGGAFGGQNPTRMFLNDGAGYFAEFNPSGFQLSNPVLANGSPGLWCEGTQSANTTNSTGAQCDVALTADDVDFADVDGDLDLDVLLCAEREPPRLYRNRREETGGTLAFRDVTGASFQDGYASTNGHYESCFGDFDGDDDLDLYGLNWASSSTNFLDNALRNSGAGFFGEMVAIPGTGEDANSAEPLDYDLDGDLDVFIANFSGQERVVRTGPGWAFAVAAGVVPPDSTTSLDSDTADVDDDGDYDVFVANASTQAEWYLRNDGTADDVTAPRFARLEQAPARVPGAAPTVVRVQLYDNAPPQTTQWYAPVLEVRVDALPAGTFPMASSFGQVFRGEIPGTFTGIVEYRAIAADEHGNSSATGWLQYSAGGRGTPFCFGDGSGTPCPCGPGAAGNGCPNSLFAGGANLASTGVASVGSDSLVLLGTSMPNSSALYFQGNSAVAFPLGDGTRCAGGSIVRLGTHTNASGGSAHPGPGDLPISVRGACAPGDTRAYQCWYRNAASFCTAATFNLTNGITVTWLP